MTNTITVNERSTLLGGGLELITDLQSRKDRIEQLKAQVDAEMTALVNGLKQFDRFSADLHKCVGLEPNKKRRQIPPANEKTAHTKSPSPEAVLVRVAVKAINKCHDANESRDNAKRAGLNAALKTAAKYGMNKLPQGLSERIDNSPKNKYGAAGR
jgi:hypothetical protein